MEQHRDDIGARLGMWIFIFTELLLFGGLFLVYAIYRNEYSAEFHNAAAELNVIFGAVNTVILLVSSMTVAMSITAMQKGNKKTALILVGFTILAALGFLVNKYFEWGHKIHLGIYPGSELIMQFERGELIFFGLYYFMTGLHGFHIVVGMIILTVIMFQIKSGKINSSDYVLLENGGLYWHLVDLIWIFLFPLMYLIT
jgi:cytochrome c oxidase subunit 3